MKKNIMTIVAALLLLIGNVFPVLAAEIVTIAFTTDQNTYTAQSKIIVTGTVLKDQAPGKGTSPTLTLRDFSGKLIEAHEWKDTDIGQSGQITKTITLGKNLEDGTYTIQLSARGAQPMTNTIEVTGYIPQKELKANLTKNDYKSGDTVEISGTVTAGNVPQNGVNVNIVIEKGGTKVGADGKATTDANGSFTFSYPIPKDTATGDYTVKVTLGDGSKTVSLNIKITKEDTPGGNPGGGNPGGGNPGGGNPGGGNPGGGNPGGGNPGGGNPGGGNPGGPVITDPIPKPTPEPIQPDVNEVTTESIAITGNAEAGTKVAATDKYTLTYTAITGTDRKFSIPLKEKLKAGTKLYVTAINSEGIVSKATEIVVVNKTAPSAPIVNEVKDSDKIVSGKAEANTKVTIKMGNQIIATGTVDTKGTFSIPITAQKAGTTLLVYVTDVSGNVSSDAKITVKDKTPPSNPTISSVAYTKISGKTEAYAKLTVIAGKKVMATGKAAKNGTFSISMKTQKVGTVLYIFATDAVGNNSKNTKVVVKDITPPGVPTVSSATTSKVTGKTEASATVLVYVGKTVIGSAKANSKGIFTVSIKKQKVGAILYVYAKDKAGNLSEYKKVTIKK